MKTIKLWMRAVALLVVYHLTLVASAQTIQNGSKWWDGGILYTATVKGNSVTMDGIGYGTEGFRFQLTRLANKQGEYVLIGTEGEAENLRAEVGWRVQYVRKDGMYFLAVRNPEGNAVWQMTLTPDDLANCQAQEANAEGQSPSDLLQNWLMNTKYLGRFPKAQLRLMRNEILAHHGYKFQSEDLQRHFGSMAWYKPVEGNADIQLSVIEELNIQLIKSEEAVPEGNRLKGDLNDEPTEGAPVSGTNENNQQRVMVHNAKEFVKAIKDNTEVIIPENTEINLSDVLDDEKLFSVGIGMNWVDDYAFDNSAMDSGRQIVASERVFDGRQLDITGVKNLTISGHKNASIVVRPRYSFVLSFYDCRNIKIKNLIIGHTEEGSCEGGVIGVRRSSAIEILNCDLYGCGTYGIVSYDCSDLKMDKSIIRDCSYGIMELHSTTNAKFTNSCFFRNREFTLISSTGNCNGLSFTNCNFWQNRGKMFSLSSKARMENCAIFHRDEFGSIEMLESATEEPGYYGGPKDEEMDVPDGIGPQ